MNDYIEWAAEVRKTIRKYETVDKTIESMLEALVFHVQSGEMKEAEQVKSEIEELLTSTYSKKVRDVVSMPAPEKTEGDITIGTVFQGDSLLHEFRMPLLDFSRHVAVFASTGHGKSVLVINVMRQILGHDVGHPESAVTFLAFDFKQDYRHLKLDPPLAVLRWEWLRLNPFLPPEGVEQTHWINLVCDVFAHSFLWFLPSKNYFYEVVMEEYERSKPGPPQIFRIDESLRAQREKTTKRSEYLDVTQNRISAICSRLRSVFNCREGIPISGLLDLPVAIELDGMDPSDAIFLISFFLLYIFEYRKAKQHRGSLEHLLIFDEAHRVFYDKSGHFYQGESLGPSIIETIPRIIRDYNEGLIFTTQEPKRLDSSVMANTGLKLVGDLGDGKDIEEIRKSLQLSFEDTALIKRLKQGQFIAQKSGVNEGSPFLVQTQDYRFEKDVTDEKLRERMADFIGDIAKEEPQSETLVELPTVSENAAKMLRHVGVEPFRNLSKRYDELHLSPKDGKAAVDELLDRRLVVVKPIQLSEGRPSAYLEPTDGGKLLLGKAGVNMEAWSDYVGRVGLEHRVFQNIIASALKRRGWQVEKEWTIGRKRLDVFAAKGDEKLGVEVCISPRLDFFDAADASKELTQLVFVCRDAKVMETMQREAALSEVNMDRFRFVIGHRYLAELSPGPQKSP